MGVPSAEDDRTHEGAPIVEITAGKLRGIRVGETSVAAFLGIPFARPASGALRYLPPQPPVGWTGIRQAVAPGPVAMQVPTILESGRGMPGPMSEDCLNLNVWSPRIPADGSDGLPVLFWIHGGAFVNGSGSVAWYDGSRLAARGDVVVVTINYRLGAFGFLDLSELGGRDYQGSGNLGLLDQVAALRWVQENIRAFGGDPDKVCLTGESAGAMSVGTLLATDAAKGMFHRAILQSGTPVAQQQESSLETASRLFHELGLPLGRPGVEKLRDLPATEIVVAADRVMLAQQAAALAGRTGGFAWSPVIDGGVLGVHPDSAVAAGASSEVPVLIGTTADEMFIARVLDPHLNEIDRGDLGSRLAAIWGSEGAAILDGYEALHPGAGADDLWWWIMSDRIFGLAVGAFVDARAQSSAPTWSYRFTWRSPLRDGYYGSAHTFEIPFVFATLAAEGVSDLLGPPTEEMRVLSGAMQDAWVAFATTGCPATDRFPEWDPNVGQDRPTMLLGDTCSVVNDPLDPVERLWAQVERSA